MTLKQICILIDEKASLHKELAVEIYRVAAHDCKESFYDDVYFRELGDIGYIYDFGWRYANETYRNVDVTHNL